MNEYRDIETSILRFAAEFGDAQGLKALNFDAHANPQEFPEGDLIGPANLRIDLEDSIYEATVAFVISTEEDPNLYRMSELMNLLFDGLKPTMRIPIYNTETGATRGNLVVADGVRVDQVINTETRAAKPLMVRLISDQAL